MGRLFPRRDEKKKDKVIAELRSIANMLNVQSSAFEKRSDKARVKAAKFMQTKNRRQAKQELLRRRKYLNKINRHQKYISVIEKRIDALDEAETTQMLSGAMFQATDLLKKAARVVNEEKVMEDKTEADLAMQEIDRAGELIADDVEDEFEDVDLELDELEEELMAGVEFGLPDSPGDVAEPTKKTKVSKSLEDLRKELE